MAKYKFTKSQFDEINLLLKRRITESRDEQKKTRRRIRKLGFMISNYFNGFNDIDFKNLLNNGEIEIIGNQFFSTTQTTKNVNTKQKTNIINGKVPKEESNYKDEHYILDYCDKVLGLTSSRQHKFDFLLGDPGKNGKCRKLPVDAFYETLKLVIEYREKQHTESVAHFDKPDKLTVSGVHRGEQRKIYDERRRKILPQHRINLIEISYSDFNFDKQKRIIRNPETDIKIVKQKLKKYLPDDK